MARSLPMEPCGLEFCTVQPSLTEPSEAAADAGCSGSDATNVQKQPLPTHDGSGLASVLAAPTLDFSAAVIAAASEAPGTGSMDLLIACWQAMERYAPLPAEPLDTQSDADAQRLGDALMEQQLLQELLGHDPVPGQDDGSVGDRASWVGEQEEEEKVASAVAEDWRVQESGAEGASAGAPAAGTELAELRACGSVKRKRSRPEEVGGTVEAVEAGGMVEAGEQQRAQVAGREEGGALSEQPGIRQPGDPDPDLALQAHVAQVARSLIRRRCTVPTSDPLAAAYGGANRDAVQL